MRRVIEAEMKTTAKLNATAIHRFFKKYPELEYWAETFDYMAENGKEHFIDDIFGDGTKNTNWSYSLWFVRNDDSVYMAVIERA